MARHFFYGAFVVPPDGRGRIQDIRPHKISIAWWLVPSLLFWTVLGVIVFG